MRKLLAIIVLFSLFTAKAQTTDRALNYINTYKDIAINEMIRTGVPAAITLAQGILESSCGESDLCKKSNNHFGIKCKNEWTGDKVYHDDDIKNECFRVYPNAEASFRDHSDFLRNRPYYQSLFQLSPTDYEAWALGLKKAGYATERDYPQRLVQIINNYNLNQYSLLALEKKNNPDIRDAIAKETPATTDNTLIPADHVTPQPETTEQQEVVERITPAANKKEKKSVANDLYPKGLFTINHCKVVYATQGTSMLAIANEYNVPLSRLLDYNDMKETDILSHNTLIFLERKLKKGAKDYHIAQPEETLYDICQAEGVRLESVLEYNYKNKNSGVTPGEKIYLRSMAPAASKNIAVSLPANGPISSKSQIL